jgi:hypothetical protein
MMQLKTLKTSFPIEKFKTRPELLECFVVLTFHTTSENWRDLLVIDIEQMVVWRPFN